MKKTFILSLTVSALVLGSLTSVAQAQSEPSAVPMVDESAPNDTASAPKAEHGKKKGHKKAKAKKHAKKKHKKS